MRQYRNLPLSDLRITPKLNHMLFADFSLPVAGNYRFWISSANNSYVHLQPSESLRWHWSHSSDGVWIVLYLGYAC